MPCDYKKYPPNWRTEIRPAILARAHNCCEWCNAPNGETIMRLRRDPVQYMVGCFEHRGTCWLRSIKVVLTVAHIDHDVTNNAPENLAALCQRCHLSHDAKQHAANAARTRAAETEAKRARREPPLPGFPQP